MTDCLNKTKKKLREAYNSEQSLELASLTGALPALKIRAARENPS